ncbi:RNA-binding protein 14-like [Rhopilema esculentum]|uniref:RNA-binding protein 14-like n=1 Tax=Rhopilema esculentum TaxID=499914 RepID=UPI0031DDC9BD|eukprot:gene1658-16129_t
MATKLYVANLPPNCTESTLHGLFSAFGLVTELDIIKNYAFVHMAASEGAQKAVAEYNNMNLNGNVITVQFSKIQNVNRGNKFTVKYDRPDRLGRGVGGNFNRGGFRGGGRGGMPGDIGHGPDFRGRGGFRGGRGGGDHLHRGKPYDRNPGLSHGQMGMGSNSNNLQPIRPVGSDVGVAQNSNPPAKFIPPQQQIPTQQLQRVPVLPTMQQTMHVQHMHHVPVAAVSPQVPQNHVANTNQQMLHHAGFQPVQTFGEMQPHAQAMAPQMHGAMQQQLVTAVGQPVSNVQPVMHSNVQPAGIAPQQGYTVYERYVDYRNPQTGEITGVVSSHQVPHAGQPVGQIYQTAAQSVNKDPYANAQMMYERQAGATSRAAVYANAYYGSSPATTMVSGANAVHQMQVVAPGNIMQPVQLHYQ